MCYSADVDKGKWAETWNELTRKEYFYCGMIKAVSPVYKQFNDVFTLKWGVRLRDALIEIDDARTQTTKTSQ